jgi:hypothetical protein
MSHQDWTVVTFKRNSSKKKPAANEEVKRNESIRMAKLDSEDAYVPKKRTQPASLQALIRKRIELSLSQEKADTLCAFPRNTFKDIESNRIVPNEKHQSIIQKQFGVQIKIDSTS